MIKPIRRLLAFRSHPEVTGSRDYRRVERTLRVTCWLIAGTTLLVAIAVILGVIAFGAFISPLYAALGLGFDSTFAMMKLGALVVVVLVLVVEWGVLVAGGSSLLKSFADAHRRWVERDPSALASVTGLGRVLLVLGLIGLLIGTASAIFVQESGAEGAAFDPTVPWQLRAIFFAIFAIPSGPLAVIGGLLSRLPERPAVRAEFA